MSNMDKKGLSGVDICKIIKQCHASGVRSIKVGEVEINFGEAPQIIDNSQPLEVGELSVNARASNDSIVDDAIEAQLMIDDPQAYEKLQTSRDIERNRHV